METDIMKGLLGLVLASAAVVATAGEAQAQVAISVGTPYLSRGLYGGAPGYAYNSYYAAPYAGVGTTVYSSGYAGYAAPYVGYPGYRYPAYGYGYPAYRYGGYGYPAYGRGFYGYRGRGWRRW